MKHFRKRHFSTQKITTPLAYCGFSSSNYIFTGLLNGDHETDWHHFSYVQRHALFSALSYLKRKQFYVNIPNPLAESFLKSLVSDLILESIQHSPPSKIKTIFHESYDLLIPLPSSTGVASKSNLEMSNIIANALPCKPSIESQLIQRVIPMAIKSTSLDDSIRRSENSVAEIHFGTLSLEPSLYDLIAGKSFLLYDDVLTYGNTSEAARNLLLLAGAKKVDCVTIFSNGPVSSSASYRLQNGIDPKETLTSRSPSPQNYLLESKSFNYKNVIDWGPGSQQSTKGWHDSLGDYIRDMFPAMVPNDVPF